MKLPATLSKLMAKVAPKPRQGPRWVKTKIKQVAASSLAGLEPALQGALSHLSDLKKPRPPAPAPAPRPRQGGGREPKVFHRLHVLKEVQDPKAKAKAQRLAAKKARRRAERRAKGHTHSPPLGGRLEAIGWFVLAGVILAWPREKPLLDLSRLSIKGLWPPGGRLVADEVSAAERAEPGRGRSARTPAEIPLKGWKDIIWRSWTEFNRDNITQVAGGVAFFGLLAIFPAIAAFVSLYGLFFDVATARKQLDLLAGVMPADALNLLGDQMIRLAAAHHSGLGAAFVVGLLVSIWSANTGMKALFVGLNIAFEETEKRGLIKLNLVSLGFTLGALIFLALALAGIVVVPAVLALIGYTGGFMPVLRWPILAIAAIGAITVLYRYGPSRQHERLHWVSSGSVIAALLWLCVSLLFSLYVAHFGSYDRTYGSLGAVVGFMSWMWISTIVILFGAELNSEIEHQTAVDTTTGAPLPMGMRGASMADTLGVARPKKAAKA
jgi:membrane protein